MDVSFPLGPHLIAPVSVSIVNCAGQNLTGFTTILALWTVADPGVADDFAHRIISVPHPIFRQRIRPEE